MSTSKDKAIDQLVQERWRAIGLSQTDLAEVLCTEPAAVTDDAKRNGGRLARVAKGLGVAPESLQRRAAADAPAPSGVPAAQSLQSLVELRMLRVFREVQDPDTKRILIELAEHIVKRQVAPPEAG